MRKPHQPRPSSISLFRFPVRSKPPPPRPPPSCAPARRRRAVARARHGRDERSVGRGHVVRARRVLLVRRSLQPGHAPAAQMGERLHAGQRQLGVLARLGARRLSLARRRARAGAIIGCARAEVAEDFRRRRLGSRAPVEPRRRDADITPHRHAASRSRGRRRSSRPSRAAGTRSSTSGLPPTGGSRRSFKSGCASSERGST